MPQDPVLAVWYLYEPDEKFYFDSDGDRITFGRDDDCDLIIFSAINGELLSRCAGRIWRMEGELWVRNLSEKHELWIVQPGLPPLPPLPPRDPARPDPGAAQSIPGDLTYVQGPDGCVLVVAQQRAEPAFPAVQVPTATTDYHVRTNSIPPRRAVGQSRLHQKCLRSLELSVVSYQ